MKLCALCGDYPFIGKKYKKTINEHQSLLHSPNYHYICHPLLDRRMKRKAKSRIIIAWTLLVTLMPLFVVKAIHHHESNDTSACHSSKGHSHTPGDQCLICQFMLSPFIQAESPQIQVFISVLDCRAINYADKDCRTMLHPYHLRAPPAKVSQAKLELLIQQT